LVGRIPLPYSAASSITCIRSYWSVS
jgi:hypothetical protein